MVGVEPAGGVVVDVVLDGGRVVGSDEGQSGDWWDRTSGQSR